jgi:hypothetical protein
MQVSGSGFLALLVLPLLLGAAPQMAPRQKAAAPAATGDVIPMPPDRAEDSYRIYSGLMPGDIFASMAPEQTGRWAIAAITVNDDDRSPPVPPQGQLKPPPDNPRGFAEAVQDYETNRHVRVQLTKQPFQLQHAFSLLSPEEVSALRASKTAPQVSSETQAQWTGYPGITFFSEVYFDSKHHAALVYMSDWCAHLCATGSWIYLEKRGGQWVRRSGVVVPGA